MSGFDFSKKAIFGGAAALLFNGGAYGVDNLDSADNKVHEYFDINIASHHDPIKRQATGFVSEDGEYQKFNELNYGFGYTRLYSLKDYGDVDVRAGASAGYYKNSIHKDSVYVMGNLEAACSLSDQWSVASGVQLGGVSGYDSINNMLVTPAGQLYIRAEYNRLSLKVGYVPKVELGNVATPSIVTLQMNYKF